MPVGCRTVQELIPPHQPELRLFALLRVIRTPGGIGALRAVTSSSPVPLAAFTEENIHAETSLDPEFEFVYPTGVASLLHFVRSQSQRTGIPP